MGVLLQTSWNVRGLGAAFQRVEGEVIVLEELKIVDVEGQTIRHI